jgi:hypothetical protein
MGVVAEATSKGIEGSEGALFFFHAAHPRIAPKSTTVPIKNVLTGDTKKISDVICPLSRVRDYLATIESAAKATRIK